MHIHRYVFIILYMYMYIHVWKKRYSNLLTDTKQSSRKYLKISYIGMLYAIIYSIWMYEVANRT